MRHSGLILAAGRVRPKKKKTGKKTKPRRTQNTPRNPLQPGQRDHLETTCDETRPTRSPILARFHRSRACVNRPRTLAQSVIKTTNVTHTQTHKLKGNGQKRELPVGSWPETGVQKYEGSKHPIWAHVIGQHYLPPVSGRTPTGTSRFSLLWSAPTRFWPHFVAFCCSSPVYSI